MSERVCGSRSDDEVRDIEVIYLGIPLLIKAIVIADVIMHVHLDLAACPYLHDPLGDLSCDSQRVPQQCQRDPPAVPAELSRDPDVARPQQLRAHHSHQLVLTLCQQCARKVQRLLFHMQTYHSVIFPLPFHCTCEQDLNACGEDILDDALPPAVVLEKVHCVARLRGKKAMHPLFCPLI